MSLSDRVAEILTLLGAQRLTFRGRKILASCPLAPWTHAGADDESPSFAVIMGDRRWPGYHCMGCNEHGTILNLVWKVKRYSKKPHTKALWIANMEIVSDVDDAPKELRTYNPIPGATKPVQRKADPQSIAPAFHGVGEQLAIGKVTPAAEPYTEDRYARYTPIFPAYMRDRGFDDETMTAFGIRDDPQNHRVVFPVRDWTGKILGVSRRLYWPHDHCYKCRSDLRTPKGKIAYACPKCDTKYAKYLHSYGMQRNDLLYGEWLYQDGAIPVISEGATDVMRVWQRGARSPLASPLGVFGAHPSDRQVSRLLQRIGPDVPIVVIRDNDLPTPKFPLGVGASVYNAFRHHLTRWSDTRRLIEVSPPDKDVGTLDAEGGKILVDVLQRLSAGALPDVRRGVTLSELAAL